MNQLTKYYFKLKQNIELEGDVLLARLEIEALISNKIEVLTDLDELALQEPLLAQLEGISNLHSLSRVNGAKGFVAYAPIIKISELIKRLSFVQRFYCLTDNISSAKSHLAQLPKSCGKVIRQHEKEGFIIIEAVPHFTIFELSEAALKKANNPEQVKKNLDLLIDELLGGSSVITSYKIASDALKIKNSSSLLSHDIHYYKAKFFPRMVRALLNIGSNTVDSKNPKVIDNFVGSGTALLESATLGFESVGTDIDPLSVLISNTKIKALYYPSDLLYEEAKRITKTIEIKPQQQKTFLSEKELFPEWLLKNRKMTAVVAKEIATEINHLRACLETAAPQFQELLQVLVSDAIARKVKMRILGTGSGRFSLSFAKTPLSRTFTKSLQSYVKVAAVGEWLRETLGIDFAPAKAVIGDARFLPEDLGTFDLLITSPPYLPASSGRESYAKARAISLRSLKIAELEMVDDLIDNAVGGMSEQKIDLTQLSNQEREVVDWLAADALRYVKAQPTAKYFLDMRQAFKEMFSVLNSGAFAAIVSGKQNTFYEFSTRKVLYTVPTAELLAEEAMHVGFSVEQLLDIQLKKANRNARPRSLDDYYETVIILRKP
ncbi:hypothetical protein H6F78_03065 [Coleofasciculus sp. FACHB-64]|uniref:hypothetical protein n=1 Tax=Cyanophyceae TaxID=3028117 RepID=UPI0016874BB0|nr:hypothetical protein [Coleofasciculus sp. FACHB-64]MBD2044621.1 hypothetical protein [Coleofasciculus sp. FACHB-64]